MFEPIIGSDYPTKVVPLINKAKKNIDIVMFDWRWYENQPAHAVQKFNIAIAQARARGVMIRAVLNFTRAKDVLEKIKVQVHLMKDRRVVHAKMILIDDEIVILGSHNLTKNAFTSNHEASIAIAIPPESTRFREYFNNLWQI